MSFRRYHTLGAVAPGLPALKGLDERLENEGVPQESLFVLARKRDLPVIGVALPDVRMGKVESSLTKMQWFEFGSMFLGVTATAVLMGAIHLWTGITVEALLIIGSIIGLVLYHKRPRLRRELRRMALPEDLASEWEERFLSGGFALVLATVPDDKFEDAQDAFLEDDSLEAPLAIDRRPVF